MKLRLLFGVYKFWQRPWGFHRFYSGLRDIPDSPCGWQFGLYLIGLECNYVR